MTNKLVVIINSLKVPKIKKILIYEMKFLVPNYSCLQNPWLGATPPDPRSLCPLFSNEFVEPPPLKKIPGYATLWKSNKLATSQLGLFQMKPTRCKLLLSIFISTSLHVLGNCVPIIRRTYCIYATMVFFALYGWLSALQPVDTVNSPHDGHIVARNMLRSWNKYTKK